MRLTSQSDCTAADGKLREADILYTREFLEEYLYEHCAVYCREAFRSAAQEVSPLLARAASATRDEEDAARYLRRCSIATPTTPTPVPLLL